MHAHLIVCLCIGTYFHMCLCVSVCTVCILIVISTLNTRSTFNKFSSVQYSIVNYR